MFLASCNYCVGLCGRGQRKQLLVYVGILTHYESVKLSQSS